MRAQARVQNIAVRRPKSVSDSHIRRIDPRQPEIQKLDAQLRHQDVPGFEIPMGDPFLVRRIQRVADLRPILERLCDWKRALATNSITR